MFLCTTDLFPYFNLLIWTGLQGTANYCVWQRILCVVHSLRRGHWVKTMNFLFKKSSLKPICGTNGRTLCWKKSPWYILFSCYLSSLAWKSFFLSTYVWFESLALLKVQETQIPKAVQNTWCDSRAEPLVAESTSLDL